MDYEESSIGLDKEKLFPINYEHKHVYIEINIVSVKKLSYLFCMNKIEGTTSWINLLFRIH